MHGSLSCRTGSGSSRLSCSSGPAARGPRAASPDRFEDLRHLSGPEQRVDLGNLLAQFVAIPLGETAGDDQPLAGALVLERRHLEDGVDRFFLRVVDEGAGVHDEDVGLVRVRRDLVTRVAGDAQHHLAVDEVLRTAEGEKADLQFQAPNFQLPKRDARESGANTDPTSQRGWRSTRLCQTASLGSWELEVGTCHGHG